MLDDCLMSKLLVLYVSETFPFVCFKLVYNNRQNLYCQLIKD